MIGDADVQRALGSAFASFARPVEAEQAYRTSLKLKDDPETRHYLAVEVMQQGRADEAETILRPILDQRKPEHIGLLPDYSRVPGAVSISRITPSRRRRLRRQSIVTPCRTMPSPWAWR
jgi:hypothetical protein